MLRIVLRSSRVLRGTVWQLLV